MRGVVPALVLHVLCMHVLCMRGLRGVVPALVHLLPPRWLHVLLVEQEDDRSDAKLPLLVNPWTNNRLALEGPRKRRFDSRGKAAATLIIKIVAALMRLACTS